MRFHKLASFVLGALLLSPPLSAQVTMREAAFAPGREGALIHSASGIEFPKEVADFRLLGTAAFDLAGEYVGVRYARALPTGGDVELRMAIVHISQMSPKAHYVIMKPLGLRGLSKVRTITEGPYKRSDASNGYRGIFAASKDGRSTMVGLFAFERGYWDFRVRAEFPKASNAEAERAVGELIEEMERVNRGKPIPRP